MGFLTVPWQGSLRISESFGPANDSRVFALQYLPIRSREVMPESRPYVELTSNRTVKLAYKLLHLCAALFFASDPILRIAA